MLSNQVESTVKVHRRTYSWKSKEYGQTEFTAEYQARAFGGGERTWFLAAVRLISDNSYICMVKNDFECILWEERLSEETSMSILI